MQTYRPEVSVHFGHFLTHEVRARLAQPIGVRRFARVERTEEKGSDVNLAVHLLNDGWLDAYDCAVVVSNDSDLAEGMRLAKAHCGKRIGLVTPGKRRTSQVLKNVADFTRHIREHALRSFAAARPHPREQPAQAVFLVAVSRRVGPGKPPFLPRWGRSHLPPVHG